MEIALLILVVVLAALALLVWAVELRTPRTVRWRDVDHEGVPARVAEGLVLQHDDGDTVWASRGYSIYRSEGGGPFRRVARVRPPFGEPWGGYSRSLRRAFGYQELLELVPLDDPDHLVVFSGGFIHQLDLGARASRRTHELRYFGRGKGRGLMAFGLTRDLDGALYFAEYVTESGDRPTGVWRSADDGATWQLAYEFEPGTIRHVHAVQCDPFDGALWIGTGDRDEHCFVGRSTDGARTFEWVGQGKQIHRTCSFAFFPDTVAWPMDADFEQNHVVRWHRGAAGPGAVTVDGELPDASYYAQALDADRFLVGVAQGVAEAWVAGRDGSTRRWLGWPVVGTPPKRGPSPGLRLARGPGCTDAVHLNPLRTIPHEAAIFRVPRSALPIS
ncbi:MAG: hypothetical protein JWM98_2794 [Thermoleophilia bacterium]|nr:hypothetical protein [Thermoleophilia bacterium]